MRVSVDSAKCVGAGVCVLTSPRVFDQHEEDGTVRLLTALPDAEDQQDVRDAVLSCPSQAISVDAD